MNQNAISRLESEDYGKPTITTLKRLAAALDVCLIVRFAPFSEVIDWVSGTPHLNSGLTSDALAVPAFAIEEARGIFSAPTVAIPDKFEQMIRGDDTGKGKVVADAFFAELAKTTPPARPPLPY